MSGFLTKLAHNNRIPINIGRPTGIKALQDLISSEKKLIDSVERTASSRSQSSITLREWAAEQGPDLSDVCEKVAILFEYLSSAEIKSAEHCESFRQNFKLIRTQEESLASLKSSKRDLAGKIDALEKKVGKMREENKDLPEASQRLRENKQEMIGLEQAVINEETALSDCKRQQTRAALDLKFGALLELAEKTTIIAELGKLLIDSIPLDRTEPGQHQQRPYYSTEKTDSIMIEAQRCIQEVHFLPAGRSQSQSNTAAMQHTAELDGDNYYPPQPQHDDFRPQHQQTASGGSGTQSFYQQQQQQSMGSNQARVISREDRERERSKEESAKYYSNEPVSPTIIDPSFSRQREFNSREMNSNNFERLPTQSSYEGNFGQDNEISAMMSYAEEEVVEDSSAVWNSRSAPAVEPHGTPIYDKSKSPPPPPIEEDHQDIESRERDQDRQNRALESEDENRSSLAYFNETPDSQHPPRFSASQLATSTSHQSLPADVVVEEEEDEIPRHSREPARVDPIYSPPNSASLPPALPRAELMMKPYVPKEGDGAYHPTDDGAYHHPNIPISTSINPPSPRLDYEPSSNNLPYNSASRGVTRPEVNRLGSKYGDLEKSTTPSTTAPIASQFQPAGISGYNNNSSRNTAEDGRGKVTAGAFRRPMATNSTQPLPSYSFTPSTPIDSYSRNAESRFSVASNNSGAISPSQSDHIRDSYRASPQYNLPTTPSVDEPVLEEDVNQFGVAPLNLRKNGDRYPS